MQAQVQFTLTKKEAKVFYGLIKNPGLTDTELATEIGVNRSYVSAIKNKLKRDKIFASILVPDLSALGCELLIFAYGKFNPPCNANMRKKSTAFKNLSKMPELVYARECDCDFIYIFASKNLTELREKFDVAISDYKKRDFILELCVVEFPIKLSNVTNFFNFAPAIKGCIRNCMKGE